MKRKKMLAIPGKLLNYLQENGIHYTERIDAKHGYPRAEFPHDSCWTKNLISSICGMRFTWNIYARSKSDHLFATSTFHRF
jgi:hypothetical protein